MQGADEGKTKVVAVNNAFPDFRVIITVHKLQLGKPSNLHASGKQLLLNLEANAFVGIFRSPIFRVSAFTCNVLRERTVLNCRLQGVIYSIERKCKFIIDCHLLRNALPEQLFHIKIVIVQ